MDFSGWFEAWLGGRWYTFDARHNKPRIGRVLIATGRDATDVAISTSFGSSRLVSFNVVTDEVVGANEIERHQHGAVGKPLGEGRGNRSDTEVGDHLDRQGRAKHGVGLVACQIEGEQPERDCGQTSAGTGASRLKLEPVEQDQY